MGEQSGSTLAAGQVPQPEYVVLRARPAETAAFYQALGAEMLFVAGADNAAYGKTGLHMQRIDAEHAEFWMALEPGPLTDMVDERSVGLQDDA
jgi:hypothetical protein